MKITLADIAQRTNSSVSLVSLVLNNRPVRVSERKRAQILREAKALGYQTKTAAPVQAAPARLSRTIAMVTPSVDLDFLTRLMNAVGAQAEEHGYNVMNFITREDPALEADALKVCRACGVEGVVLNTCGADKCAALAQQLCREGMPMVQVDRHLEELSCDKVLAENYQGARTMTRELIRQGHRGILFVLHGMAVNTSVLRARFLGYADAMTEAGLPCLKEYVFQNVSIERQSILHYATGALPFTAVLLSTSWDFSGLLELMRHMEIPKEQKLKVAAFDYFSIRYDTMANREMLSWIDPKLLIARQDAEEMGRVAVNLLMGRIHSRRSSKGTSAQTITLPVELMQQQIPQF